MVKNLSCVSHGSLKRFPHKFTNVTYFCIKYIFLHKIGLNLLCVKLFCWSKGENEQANIVHP